MEIKTLNEQIERLKELVRKCYATVAGKNGTVPEVGERNMENLPAAIASTHDTLEELTITQNGEYTPQEGVDGFSKVVAEFYTSSLPKVKVSKFNVTDACINDDGRWDGENFIDTSECENFSFLGCQKLVELDANDWDTRKVTSLSQAFGGRECDADKNLVTLHCSNWDTSNVTSFHNIFQNCYSLKNIDVSKWNTSSATNLRSFFLVCRALEVVDCTNWDASKVTDVTTAFGYCSKLRSIIGSRTIGDVIENNISVLNGLKISADMFAYPTNIDRASLRAVINGLADLTGQTTQTLTLGATLMAKLTEEDIAIATNKNWTVL